AQMRDERLELGPDHDHLPARIEKQIDVQDSSRDERGRHVPVGGDHPKGDVVGARRPGDGIQVLVLRREESLNEPLPRRSQLLVPEQLVELQDQLRVLVSWNRPLHAFSSCLSRSSTTLADASRTERPNVLRVTWT